MTTYYLFRLFFDNLIRDKFFSFVLFSGALYGFFAVVLNEISYGANEMVVRSFSLGFVSLTINFLSIYFGLSMVTSEAMKHSVVVLLCKPMKRIEVIIGATVAFSFAVLISLLLISFQLRFVFALYGIGVDNLYLFGLLGIFFEGVIIFSLSLFFSLYLNNLISVLFIFCFYILGHNLQGFLELGFFKDKPILVSFLVFCSKIFPDLSKFDFKYVVYNITDFKSYIFSGVGYFWVSLFVITSLTGYFFSKRDYT